MPQADHLRAVVPAELQQYDQWVTWTIKETQKKSGEVKYDKIPRNPHTGAFASSTDPATWSTFDQAVEAMVARHHNGIGFVLAEGTPIVGIDLDDCVKNDEVEDWASNLINQLDSYTEVSPSGKGVRIFVLGKKTVAECRKGSIEVYNWGRFLTVTGKRLQGSLPSVMPRQEALETFFKAVFGSATTEHRPSTPGTNGNGAVRGKNTGKLITTPFVINPNAEPPFKKWQALCLLQPKAADLFNHYDHATDHLDGNRSKIEQALANYAVMYGWEDQEVVDLLIAHSITHGEGVKHLRYYQHTITTAHDEVTRHNALERLGKTEKGEDTGPHDTGPPRPPQLQVVPADVEDTAGFLSPEAGVPSTEEDDLLLGEEGLISQALGLVVTKILKYDSEPPSYRLITGRGEVYLPSVTKLIHQGFLREALAMVGHYLKPIAKDVWPTVAQALLDACSVVAVGEDSRELGQVATWLQLYLAERRIKESLDSAVNSKFPYMEHDHLHVFGSDFYGFIKNSLKEQINPIMFGAKMRAFSAEPLQVRCQKPNGHRTTYNVWRLPANYKP